MSCVEQKVTTCQSIVLQVKCFTYFFTLMNILKYIYLIHILIEHTARSRSIILFEYDVGNL